MSLWEWTLEAYARPGVPAQSLRLQDEFGQHTSLLLWAVWAEAADRRLLADAAEVARSWEAHALGPIREIRRALKTPFPPIDDRAREGLREDIKAAELRAERVLMETLEAMVGDRRGGAHALDALKAASAAWGRPVPDGELAALAAALG